MASDADPLRKSVLVTGGSGGVGAAICSLLADEGWDIGLTYRSRPERAAETVAAVRALGREGEAWQTDLTDVQAATRLAGRFAERFGSAAALVHAAGPYVDQLHLSAVEPERFRRHLDGEAAAFFNVVSALLPQLRERAGAIVAVTSVAVRRFPPRDGLSSAPKAAVEALVRALAVEEGRFGIRANCVAPGILDGGMTHRLIDSEEMHQRALDAARSRIPLGRFGAVAEVAELARFLISERAGYLTGQTIDIDGGYSL